ncbi:MAG: type 1 glutamine amidotransferase [Thermodesulfovibrionales bacterium]
MRLHSLQHVPFEDLACIEPWAAGKKYDITKTLLYENNDLPGLNDFDALFIMGGPMGVNDDDKYPWLTEEKKFIEKAISANKIVIGICLGAQLVASVLGAKVYRNEHKEIGWYPVRTTEAAQDSLVFRTLPQEFMAFHWHGDAFDIPSGAIRMAESNGCSSQAFEYNIKVVGLQFHLESTRDSIDKLITNCGDEIVEGKYIQPPEKMFRAINEVTLTNQSMRTFLDNLFTLKGRKMI